MIHDHASTYSQLTNARGFFPPLPPSHNIAPHAPRLQLRRVFVVLTGARDSSIVSSVRAAGAPRVHSAPPLLACLCSPREVCTSRHHRLHLSIGDIRHAEARRQIGVRHRTGGRRRRSRSRLHSPSAAARRRPRRDGRRASRREANEGRPTRGMRTHTGGGGRGGGRSGGCCCGGRGRRRASCWCCGCSCGCFALADGNREEGASNFYRLAHLNMNGLDRAGVRRFGLNRHLVCEQHSRPRPTRQP